MKHEMKLSHKKSDKTMQLYFSEKRSRFAPLCLSFTCAVPAGGEVHSAPKLEPTYTDCGPGACEIDGISQIHRRNLARVSSGKKLAQGDTDRTEGSRGR